MMTMNSKAIEIFTVLLFSDIEHCWTNLLNNSINFHNFREMELAGADRKCVLSLLELVHVVYLLKNFALIIEIYLFYRVRVFIYNCYALTGISKLVKIFFLHRNTWFKKIPNKTLTNAFIFTIFGLIKCTGCSWSRDPFRVDK